MPRPRLTVEELEARIQEYCQRYGVVPGDSGLPPFPTGRRETRQHRDWIAVYKAHNRLARHRRGQCERCEAPASDGLVFCEEHRAGGAQAGAASVQERKAVLVAQANRCPICAQKVGLSDVLGPKGRRSQRALLHARCNRFVVLAERLGPAGVERLLAYLGHAASGKAPR